MSRQAHCLPASDVATGSLARRMGAHGVRTGYLVFRVAARAAPWCCAGVLFLLGVAVLAVPCMREHADYGAFVRVRGRVLDALTGGPIQGAWVYVGGSSETVSDPTWRHEVRSLWLELQEDLQASYMGFGVTDQDGHFDLTLNPTSSYEGSHWLVSCAPTPKIPDYFGVAGVWVEHPYYGDLLVNGRIGRWLDRSPSGGLRKFELNLGVIELTGPTDHPGR